MSEETKVTPETSEGQGEETTSVSIEELKKAQELAENYKIRAEKAEAKAKASEKQEEPVKNINNNGESDEKLERLNLKVDGFDDETIDEIMSLGGSKILQNETVKNAYLDKVKQKKTESAVSVDGSVKSGGAATKYSKAEIEDMSAEEYRQKVINKSTG